MTQTGTSTASAPAASKNLAARVIGVLTSPRATYADVAARPRVLGVLVLIAALGCGSVYAFMSTEIGQQAWLDAAVRQQESFGRTLSDAQYARMEQMAKLAPYFGAAAQAVVLPLAAVILSGILLGVFNALLGGDATFKQVLAIVSHSGIVMTLAQLFGLPLAYARETLSSATNLAVFFPFLDENSFAARFLGMIDLFWIWWIVSLSIGLGVLYKRRTNGIATTLLIVYVVIALAIAVVRVALSGA